MAATERAAHPQGLPCQGAALQPPLSGHRAPNSPSHLNAELPGENDSSWQAGESTPVNSRPPTTFWGHCQGELEELSTRAESVTMRFYSLVQQQLGEFHVIGAGHGGEGVFPTLAVPDLLQFS